MQLMPADEGITHLEWTYQGAVCRGLYQERGACATLNFLLPNGSVTIVYRILDADTMAVCITEANDMHTPTIQYGNMCRLPPSQEENEG